VRKNMLSDMKCHCNACKSSPALGFMNWHINCFILVRATIVT
jgi:hypothetical protein